MVDARSEVVAVAKAMLAGELSYAEGAYQICRLRNRVGGIGDRDEDFDVFVANRIRDGSLAFAGAEASLVGRGFEGIGA